MEMNPRLLRKGYFFSLTVIILLGLIATYAATHDAPRYQDRAGVTATRLVEAEDLLDAIEQDSRTALRVASYRAFLTLHEAVLSEEGYVDDLEATFERLVTNGTIAGRNQSMLNATTINDWQAQTARVARHLHFTLTYGEADITAYQENPWHVTVELDTTLHLKDARTDAQWDIPLNTTAEVPIEGLHDPLYTVGTQQRYTRRITPAPRGASADDLIHDRLYINSTRGPSYLQRLQGDITGSEHGIESLVNVTRLIAVNAEGYGSIIDWHYLDQPRPADCAVSPSLPGWAIINTTRPERFGVTCP